MAAVTEQEMMEMANQFIDKQFPTPLGNKRNYELKDKQAVERTLLFIAGFSRAMERALKMLTS